MSPTKQAKSQGNSGKEPKHQVTECLAEHFGRIQAQSGASSPLAKVGTV